METELITFFSTWGLIGTFAVLYLAGLGLPVPEEVTLLASGYVASLGAFDPWHASGVAILGILAGDSTIYYIGRRWGRQATSGPLRRILTEERIRRAEESFHERRDLVLFLARFVAGARVVVYFTTGMLRVSFWRFLLLDFLGALISGPTSVFIAYYLGTYLSFKVILEKLHHYQNYAILALVLSVLGVLLYRKLYRRVKAFMMPEPSALPTVAPPEVDSEEAQPHATAVSAMNSSPQAGDSL